jgi:hypothetical protein
VLLERFHHAGEVEQAAAEAVDLVHPRKPIATLLARPQNLTDDFSKYKKVDGTLFVLIA